MTAQNRYKTSLSNLFAAWSHTVQVEISSSSLLLQALLKSADIHTTPTIHSVSQLITHSSATTEQKQTALSAATRFFSEMSLHQIDVLLHEFLLALTADGCSKATLRNYRSDISQFLSFTNKTQISEVFTKTQIGNFARYQNEKGLKDTSIERKIKVINQFAEWLVQELLLTTNPITDYRLAAVLSQASQQALPTQTRTISLPQIPVTQENSTTVSLIKKQEQRFGIQNRLSSLASRVQQQTKQLALTYLNFALIVLFFLGLGVFGYQQFFAEVPQEFAYPSAPTRPNRVLSFQGRLTDSALNPITTATNFTFTLHDALTLGNQLWSSGTCSITPDQDGIFNTSLGSACGAEIDATIFSEYANIWLQVGVAGETLTPRQAIHTVAYALNSETLQGYPITATEAATRDTVVVMNSSGQVVLGENSPGIVSTSGTFYLEGQSLQLQTTTGSNGNITFAPNGLGNVISKRYIEAPGATLSATYAGGTALTLRGGPSGTADIFLAETSAGSDLVTISSAGLITTASDLAVNGGDITSTGSLTLTPTATLTLNSTGDMTLDSSTDIIFDADGADVVLKDAGVTFATLTNSSTDLTLTTAGGNFLSSSALNFGGAAAAAYNYFASSIAGVSTPDGVADLYIQDELEVDGTTTFGNVTYTWPGADGTSGYVLSTNGSGTLSWTGAATDSSIFWTQANGTLFPKNSTVDMLIGGQSTASAKFAVLNIDSGTPTASLSAGTTGGAYLTAAGNLQTTAEQSLILGGSTTGNILLDENTFIGSLATGLNITIGGVISDSNANVLIADSVDITGALSTTGDIAVNGDDITSDGTLTITPTSTLTLNSTGDMTLDSSTDIILDADGADVILKDAGTTFATLTNSSTDLTLDIVGGHLLLANGDTLNVGGGAASAFNFFADSVAGASTPDGDSDLYIQDELEVDGTTRFGNVTYTWPGADGSSGYVLSTNGSGTLSWTAAATDSSIYWNQANGTLFPKNSTVDMLIGGQSTESAKFAVLNVDSGTPTASLSAGTTGGAYLTAAGSLQTTANQSLTLGGSTTGNIVLNDNSFIGSETTGINITTAGLISDVNGNVVIDDVVDLGSAANGINITTAGVISDSNGNVSINDSTDITGDLSTTGDAAINGGDITSTGSLTLTPTTTLSLFSTGDMTLDSTTDIVLDAAGADVLLKNAGVTFATLTDSSTDLTLTIAGGNFLSSSALNFGGAAAAAYNYFASSIAGVSTPDGVADLYIQDELEVDGTTTFGNLTYTWPGSQSAGYVLQTNGSGTLSWIDSASIGNYWRLGSGALSPTNDTVDLLVGSNASASAKFAVLNVNSGTPTASVSAGAAGAAYLTATGNLQSTAQQTLTLGGATTGNLDFKPNSESDDYLTIRSSGSDLSFSITGSQLILANTNTINIGGTTAARAYNSISGTAAPANAGIDADNDLYIEDQLEVTSYIYGDRFYEVGNTNYFLDPASTGTALAINGDAIFGGTTPSARIHAIKTTEQLRLGYDASNYLSFTIGSTGNATIDPTGTGGTTVTFASEVSLNADGNGTFNSGSGDLFLGASQDLELYHDSADSWIVNNTGALNLEGFATSEVVVNNTAQNVDFRVEGDTDTQLLSVDAGLDVIGIGSAGVTNRKLNVSFSTTSASDIYGVYSTIGYTNSGAKTGRAFYAEPSYNVSSGTLSGLTGYQASVMNAGTGGTITSAAAFAGTANMTSGTTITTFSIFDGSTGTGAGSIGTQYGIHFNALTKATNNYTLWSDGGDMVLAADGDGSAGGSSNGGGLYLGASQDLEFYHNGTNSYIVNNTGALVLEGVAGQSIVLNDASADIDIRIESDGDANFFYLDSASNRLGLGAGATPAHQLHVSGSSAGNALVAINDTSAINDIFTASKSGVTQVRIDTSGNIWGAKAIGSLYSYFGEEFNRQLANTTADVAAAAGNIGETDAWSFDENTVARISTPFVVNGLMAIDFPSTTGSQGGMIYVGDDTTVNTIAPYWDVDNKPIYVGKFQTVTTNVGANHCFFAGMTEQTAAVAGSDCKAVGAAESLLGFTNTTATLQAIAQTGTASRTTQTCTGATIVVNQAFWVRYEVYSTSSVKFWYDMNVDDGVVNETYCGEITTNIPTDNMTLAVDFSTSDAANAGAFRADYIRVWQDDNVQTGGSVPFVQEVETYNPVSGSDIAEKYLSEDPANTVAGNIVAVGSKNYYVKNSDIAYDSKLIGVVSTSPSGKPLGQTWDAVGTGEEITRPIALNGRVPVRIDPTSQPISRGDRITSSGNNGMGMKALKAGATIGIAIEDWAPGTGQETVLTFINPGSFDPDLALSETGTLLFNKEVNGEYTVTQSDGTTIDRVIRLGQAAIGTIKAGLVSTQELIASIRVSTPEIQTDIISPLSDNSLALQLGENTASKAATLSVLNASGSAVATIDSQGNASFSGEVAASTLNAESARITALEANVAQLKHIKADTAELLSATISGTLFADDISGFQDKVANALKQPSLLSQLIDDQEQDASTAASVAQLFTVVEEAGYNATGAATLNKSVADLNLSETDLSISASAAFINQYFEVNGSAYISESLGVQNSILIGDGLTLSESGISQTATASNPSGTLALQPSGVGKVDVLAGVMSITDDGLVTITGDLRVAGSVTVDDTLLTDLLKPTNFGNPFQVQVAGTASDSSEVKDSRFEIVDELGTPVATISADGKATFAGGLGIGAQDISGDTDGEADAGKTTGKAVVAAGSNGTTITNSAVTSGSLIYVTPIGSTSNQVLYIKNQEPGKFTVGFDTSTTQAVQFTWWIIN